MKKLWNKLVGFWTRVTTYFINRHRVNAWVYSNWDQYQKMVDMINTAENLDELKKWLYQQPVEEAVVLPGSDIGMGIIKGSHWGAALMAHHFNDLLQKAHAENFLEITFSPSAKRILRGDKNLIVTIQKVEGITPTGKIKILENKVTELEKELEEMKTLAINATLGLPHEDCPECGTETGHRSTDRIVAS